MPFVYAFNTLVRCGIDYPSRRLSALVKPLAPRLPPYGYTLQLPYVTRLVSVGFRSTVAERAPHKPFAGLFCSPFPHMYSVSVYAHMGA